MTDPLAAHPPRDTDISATTPAMTFLVAEMDGAGESWRPAGLAPLRYP